LIRFLNSLLIVLTCLIRILNFLNHVLHITVKLISWSFSRYNSLGPLIFFQSCIRFSCVLYMRLITSCNSNCICLSVRCWSRRSWSFQLTISLSLWVDSTWSSSKALWNTPVRIYRWSRVYWRSISVSISCRLCCFASQICNWGSSCLRSVLFWLWKVRLFCLLRHLRSLVLRWLLDSLFSFFSNSLCLLLNSELFFFLLSFLLLLFFQL